MKKIYENKKKKKIINVLFFKNPNILFVPKINFYLFLLSSTNGGGKTNWFETLFLNLKEFFSIWPLFQWITSLIGLIVLYWITGYYYNKWLASSGGWLDVKTRCWLIATDLSINLILGLYYMNYRQTTMGIIMMKCPIAISPLIFCLELLCVYWYYAQKKKQKKGL